MRASREAAAGRGRGGPRRAATCAALLAGALLASALTAAGAAVAAEPAPAPDAPPPPPRPLVVNLAGTWPISSPEGTGLFDRLVREGFARVGVPVRLQALPAERALLNANAGLDDGDGPRIREMDTLYPNLVRVDEPLLVYELVALTREPIPEPVSVEALRPYHVAAVRGWKINERMISGTRAPVLVRTPRLLLLLLAKGRADVVVHERLSALDLVAALGLEGVRVLQPPLASRPMYLFLHKRHAALAPRLAATFRAMKEDGTWSRLAREVLGDQAPAPPREVPGG